MATDPFDDVFNLEDQFYEDGYRQGTEDGIRAGKVEGRSFGLEKGYEKFLESGRLFGKAIVWANRLPQQREQEESWPDQDLPRTGLPRDGQDPKALPLLSNNTRLEKNITTLHGLVEPESLSTKNDDISVNDFDDRIKRAQGKAKIIEKAIGETGLGSGAASERQNAPGAEGNGTPQQPLAAARAGW